MVKPLSLRFFSLIFLLEALRILSVLPKYQKEDGKYAAPEAQFRETPRADSGAHRACREILTVPCSGRDKFPAYAGTSFERVER